ncbi:16S rRNA (guanine(527)-N(7))-methyltransferase RsmG [Marinobacteraceae bacterium S3BR75-40.1]
MADATSRSLLHQGLQTLQIAVTPEQEERLLAFLDLLAKWNKAYNLTAVRDPHEMVARHLLDSVSIAPWVTASRVLDVGAGGGLPGVPLAILAPERSFELLDSNGKKTRFLLQCKLELGLDNLTVHHCRAEDYQPRDGFELITSRAFTALANLVTWCEHLLAPGGRFLAMKGTFPEDEVADLSSGWALLEQHRLQVPGCEADRHLLMIGRTDQ